MLRVNFTDEQLDFINEVKKEVGQQYVWHLLEYERVCRLLNHTPTSEEMRQNAGETRDGKWQFIIGGLKESGYIIEWSVEDEMELTRIHDMIYMMGVNYISRFFKARTTPEQKLIAVDAIKAYVKPQYDTVEEKYHPAINNALDEIIEYINKD